MERIGARIYATEKGVRAP